MLIISDCSWFLSSKTTSLVISRGQGFTANLYTFAHMPQQNLQQHQWMERDPAASYSIGTLEGLFFLFSGVMDAQHWQSKLLYLTLQVLYSLVPNRLNTQGLVLHSLKINKPNSKLSMPLPPSPSLSIHLCQTETILHFASWFSWICEWVFHVSKILLSFMLISKELFCIKRH